VIGPAPSGAPIAITSEDRNLAFPQMSVAKPSRGRIAEARLGRLGHACVAFPSLVFQLKGQNGDGIAGPVEFGQRRSPTARR
jgi:hypothetical protein